MSRDPRCIVVLNGGDRCPRTAATTMGDYFCCRRHGRIQLLVMTDALNVATRAMLAYARWTTAAEARQLIARWHQRRVA